MRILWGYELDILFHSVVVLDFSKSLVMNFKPEEIEIKNLDHLGIVAGIIDEIGIVEKINIEF